MTEIRTEIDKYTNIKDKKILRAKFMIGDIDEKTFKQLLFKNYKQVSRYQEILDILTLFHSALSSMLNEGIVKKDIQLFTTQLNYIVNHVNYELQQIQQIYKNKCFQFNIKVLNSHLNLELNTL